MLTSRFHRSITVPLVLGGMLLVWDSIWERLADCLGVSSVSAILMSDSSSGIDPNGRPTTTTTTGSADSESSSGIDPLGRP